MNTMRKIVQSDGTGTVHVEGVPPRQKVEVVLVWESENTSSEELLRRKRAELEELAGALADDPVERPPQGSFEIREPVE